eukprot:GHVT01028524.1.p1 GENE.GHVT01028524.1~~GHVT01028524.1.p1  ORF type:complete len:264 (+),score=39.35 GHVT01028524.1:843-1634(+)
MCVLLFGGMDSLVSELDRMLCGQHSSFFFRIGRPLIFTLKFIGCPWVFWSIFEREIFGRKLDADVLYPFVSLLTHAWTAAVVVIWVIALTPLVAFLIFPDPFPSWFGFPFKLVDFALFPTHPTRCRIPFRQHLANIADAFAEFAAPSLSPHVGDHLNLVAAKSPRKKRNSILQQQNKAANEQPLNRQMPRIQCYQQHEGAGVANELTDARQQAQQRKSQLIAMALLNLMAQPGPHPAGEGAQPPGGQVSLPRDGEEKPKRQST